MAEGSWHIEATPQSLAELGHLAYIGTKTSSERKDILFLGVLSQLKDLAFPVDYSEVGEPKKISRVSLSYSLFWSSLLRSLIWTPHYLLLLLLRVTRCVTMGTDPTPANARADDFKL